MKTRLFIKSFAMASLAIVLMQGCSKDESEVAVKEEGATWSVRPSFTTLDTRPESEIALHKVTKLQAEPVKLNTLKATGKYALVIGISDYDGYQYDLSYCDDDARDWANLLRSKGYTVTELIDQNATINNIKDAVRYLASLSSQGTEIAFCYSGHGGSGNIVTSDLYYISHDWFETTFYNSTSSKMLFSFDACEIGAMSGLAASGRIVALASGTNTYSYDGDYSMKNGVFTYYQMKGFNEMGYSYVEVDSEYAVSQMRSWAYYSHVTVSPSYVDYYSGYFSL